MSGLKLTRESILDDSLRASARALLGPDARFMTDAERAAQIDSMIAAAPRPDRIWVFGYGSLIWNPAFHFVDRRRARIHGFHRQFCLLSKAGRGSPERPGLMLGLLPGGSCHGVAYRIAPDAVRTELDVVWRREMGAMSYRPVWVAARTPDGIEHAIAFAVDRGHERYTPHLDLHQVARYLAHGAGPLGRCCDYLFDTIAHLRALGLRDRHLETLESMVRMRINEHAHAEGSMTRHGASATR